MTTPAAVTAADVRAARELLAGVIEPTPLMHSRWLAGIVGGPVYLKCENLQRAGSFKLRGAYVRMSRLSEAERARGVVAASAGNHAQGVALAARMLGISATVFMPHGAPIPKERATRGYGADITFVGTTIDECLVAAKEYEAETGAVLIHPFDHPDIVAGQATCGLEIAAQAPDVRTVLVPIGGGGLAAGIALALRDPSLSGIADPPTIVGVQAAAAAAYPDSLTAGRPVPVESMKTMADGIAVGCPGGVPFEVIASQVDQVVTVTEAQISSALVSVLERAKQVVEPAGATAVAALLAAPRAYTPPVAVVLSGGNIDPLLLIRVMQHGMAVAGRYLAIRVTVDDSPGGLARLLDRIASYEANVLEVTHERISANLQPREVDIAIQLETRGREHEQQVMAGLTEHGYRVRYEHPQQG